MIFHRSVWTAPDPATSLWLMIRNVARYAAGRARRAAAVVSVLLMGLSLTPGVHAASVPVLMVLQYTVAGNTIQTPITTQSGFVSAPDQGKPEAQWIILTGDAIPSAARPGDRAVGFYQGTGSNGILLFVIKVRYYQNSSGLWVPLFQLDEEPLVARINGRWQPLTTIRGAPGLIVQTGTALPNADGYSTALKFGFTTGPTSIDSWIVQ